MSLARIHVGKFMPHRTAWWVEETMMKIALILILSMAAAAGRCIAEDAKDPKVQVVTDFARAMFMEDREAIVKLCTEDLGQYFKSYFWIRKTLGKDAAAQKSEEPTISDVKFVKNDTVMSSDLRWEQEGAFYNVTVNKKHLVVALDKKNRVLLVNDAEEETADKPGPMKASPAP